MTATNTAGPIKRSPELQAIATSQRESFSKFS
jgi:hypothetical protein